MGSDGVLTPQEIENMRIAQEGWAAIAAARKADLVSNLPSWSQVSTAVDNIGNLADAKAFLKKLSRVVYWLAKDSGE